jgi:hypothetical protein
MGTGWPSTDGHRHPADCCSAELSAGAKPRVGLHPTCFKSPFCLRKELYVRIPRVCATATPPGQLQAGSLTCLSASGVQTEPRPRENLLVGAGIGLQQQSKAVQRTQPHEVLASTQQGRSNTSAIPPNLDLFHSLCSSRHIPRGVHTLLLQTYHTRGPHDRNCYRIDASSTLKPQLSQGDCIEHQEQLLLQLRLLAHTPRPSEALLQLLLLLPCLRLTTNPSTSRRSANAITAARLAAIAAAVADQVQLLLLLSCPCLLLLPPLHASP